MTEPISRYEEQSDQLIVRGSPRARPRGDVTVPGDKSISHRALMLAAIAGGTSHLRGLSTGEDVVCTLAAVRAMGIEVVGRDDVVAVHGGALREPSAVVDVGNSGTALRLLTGLWAGQQGLAVFDGDRSLALRPIDRVATPLRLMGAEIDGRSDGRFTPVAVRGRPLRGISYTLPVASAQLKSAVLIAGLFA